MKIVCDRGELAEALGLAASIVPARSTKPVLQSVLVRASKSGVEILATDLEVGVRVKVEKADVEREGQALLPAQKALSIAREVEGEKVEIATDDRVTTIKAQGAKFRVVGDDPAEFPDVPDMAGDALHFGRTQLEAMIRKTVFAAALEGARYALNGVLFDLRGDRLRLVATDGKRLALAERPVEVAGGQKFARVVPTKAVQLLAKIAHADDPTLAIAVKEAQILAKSSRAVLSAQLLQGAFPPYEEVIPKAQDKHVELETAVFEKALRRAALLTTKDSKAVRFGFAYNKLTLSSKTPDVGESEIELPVVYPSDPLEIGFDPAYLQDALKAVDGERITIELKDETSPGVIREGESFVYVVMPINIV